jgi:hypothetical protein
MKTKLAATGGATQTFVDDVFSTWLYTGNGSTQTITNGIDLAGKGGMVWTKSRSNAQNNWLFDTVRGSNSPLGSNINGIASDNYATYFSPATGIVSASSTGYSLAATTGGTNTNNFTYASWTFREAAKFFDVVTFTANDLSSQTISHNLGVKPGMIFVKQISGAQNWICYHQSLGATNGIFLNLSNAAFASSGYWNNTEPTSSEFTVGNVISSVTGGQFVAYLFAHDTSSTGIIQCGSFTTDGSGSATVNLGWEPQYVLSKASSMAGVPWVIADTMRGFNVNTTDNVNELYPNWSDKEFLNSYIQLTGTGFKSTNQLQPSTTYIYMAIRMPNKPPTSGTQVYYGEASTNSSTIFAPNFPVDMMITNVRTGGFNNPIGDRLRGSKPYLFTQVTDAEGSYEWAKFNGNTGQMQQVYFTGAGSYMNWMFKRAPGFFDVVCFNSINSTNQRVSHNLGVAPEMCITHARSEAGQWRVYHDFTGLSYYTQLQSTSASNNFTNIWGATNPTSTDMGFNSANIFGSPNTATAVAYLFATLAGISKVGSYTGNGTGQTIACGFSGGARFVLIRRTDSTGSWYTFDSARGLTSGSSPYLLLNSTAVEVTGNNGVYASSGGFTLGATAITTTNIATASYIFLAVA